MKRKEIIKSKKDQVKFEIVGIPDSMMEEE